MWQLRWGFIPHQSLEPPRHPLQHYTELPQSSLHHQLPLELQLHITQYLDHTLIVKQYKEVHVVRWPRKADDPGPRVTVYVSIYHSRASYNHFDNLLGIAHYTQHVFKHESQLRIHRRLWPETANLFVLHRGNFNQHSHLPLPPSDSHRKRPRQQS
jgi:hypothetical protein